MNLNHAIITGIHQHAHISTKKVSFTESFLNLKFFLMKTFILSEKAAPKRTTNKTHFIPNVNREQAFTQKKVLIVELTHIIELDLYKHYRCRFSMRGFCCVV